MNYEVWVKRRFWFGFRKLRCYGFETENVGNSARLVMTMKNQTIVALPRIDRREFRVYSINKPVPLPEPELLDTALE